MTEMSHQGFEEAGATNVTASAVNIATDLLSAYVSNNVVPEDKLVGLLERVTDFYEKRLGTVGGASASPAAAFANQPQEAARTVEDVQPSRATLPDQTQQAAAPQEEVQPSRSAPSRAARTSERPTPAVSIRDSVPDHGDYIICLEDGEKLKVLKRHLKKKYDMTPEDYRKRWSLPPDYPMTARNYSESRSALAKSMGFGKRKIAEVAAQAE